MSDLQGRTWNNAPADKPWVRCSRSSPSNQTQAVGCVVGDRALTVGVNPPSYTRHGLRLPHRPRNHFDTQIA